MNKDLDSIESGLGLASDGQPIWATTERILEDDMKTYTEDEVKDLVEQAVAEATILLNDKIATLESSVQEDVVVESTDSSAEEINVLNDTIKELHAKLDAAVLDAETQRQERECLIAFLEAEKAEIDRREEIAKLREERLAKVAEIATFPEEYLVANADRWAAMTEEDFAATVADYAVVGKKRTSVEETSIPSQTALVAAKEVATKGGSALNDIFGMRLQGIDARTVL